MLRTCIVSEPEYPARAGRRASGFVTDRQRGDEFVLTSSAAGGANGREARVFRGPIGLAPGGVEGDEVLCASARPVAGLEALMANEPLRAALRDLIQASFPRRSGAPAASSSRGPRRVAADGDRTRTSRWKDSVRRNVIRAAPLATRRADRRSTPPRRKTGGPDRRGCPRPPHAPSSATRRYRSSAGNAGCVPRGRGTAPDPTGTPPASRPYGRGGRAAAPGSLTPPSPATRTVGVVRAFAAMPLLNHFGESRSRTGPPSIAQATAAVHDGAGGSRTTA